MLEMLQLDFMQNALIAGILVSIACGVMGSLVVVNKLSSIAGGIAHASYGGVGLAVFLGFSPVLGSLGFSLLCAILMGILTWKDRHRSDTLIGVIWALGMALGVILTDLTPGYNGEMTSFLFGSILTVPRELLSLMLVLLTIILITVSVFFKRLLSVSYDPEFARSRGERVLLLYMLLVSLVALTVVMAVQAVGLILVIALLTLPAFIAETYSRSLFSMMIIASVISLVLVVSGLFISYSLNLVTGPVIIILGAICYLVHLLIKKLVYSK